MSSTLCPDCGSEPAGGETCREVFDRCMALEFENPGTYGAVHHLTVLCYMLQHGGYSRDGWLAARDLLRRFVREGASPAAIRDDVRRKLNAGKSVLRGPQFPEAGGVFWTRHITGVRRDSPEIYCRDVKEWAKAVLADTNHLQCLRSP